MKKIIFVILTLLLFFGCSTNNRNTNVSRTSTAENSASFWLLTSIPEDFRVQPTPTAIGQSNIVNNALTVELVEPHNFEGRGWWTFSNRPWTGEGDYYILFVPMTWNQNGGFTWEFREALIYTGDSSVPDKVNVKSNRIEFSLQQLNRPFKHSTTKKTASEFSLTFIEDKAWDQIQIFNMLRPNEPGGFGNRVETMGIDYDFARRIQNARNYSEVQEELNIFVDERYLRVGNNLRTSIDDYAASWDLIIQEFTDVVLELTQHDWFYDNYDVVVSAFHRGLSNWYGNFVTRLYGDDPIDQRYITAFELVLSHVFHISRHYFNQTDAPDHIIWAISEISAALILRDDRLLELWGDGYILHRNSLTGYPQLLELESELITIYNNMVDFTDFLNKAIQVAREMNRNFLMPINH